MSRLVENLAKTADTPSSVLDAAWKKCLKNGDPDKSIYTSAGRAKTVREVFAGNPNISQSLVQELVDWRLKSENPSNFAGFRTATDVAKALLGNPSGRDADLQVLLTHDGTLLEDYDCWAEARQDVKNMLKATPWPYVGAVGDSEDRSMPDTTALHKTVAEIMGELNPAELALFFELETEFEGTLGELVETVKAVL